MTSGGDAWAGLVAKGSISSAGQVCILSLRLIANGIDSIDLLSPSGHDFICDRSTSDWYIPQEAVPIGTLNGTVQRARSASSTFGPQGISGDAESLV